MKKAQLIELLKSGNFTIRYDDNGAGDIVKGRWDTYEKSCKKAVLEFGGQGDGYAPVEVELLVEALGGKVQSI